jgi:hypothetical protein
MKTIALIFCAAACFITGCTVTAQQDPATGKPTFGVAGTLTLQDAKTIVALVKEQSKKQK